MPFLFPAYFRYLTYLIPLAHFSILVFLILAAIQDHKTREVSNWITVPLFLGGVAIIMVRLDPLSVILSALLFFFWLWGRMGGADVKVLVALLGLWGEAAFASFFLLGVWGLVLLIRKKRESFPGLVVIAAGTGLTFLGELSIMLLNRGVSH
jgi:Flp pilus assembly protein protease CpaA